MVPQLPQGLLQQQPLHHSLAQPRAKWGKQLNPPSTPNPAREGKGHRAALQEAQLYLNKYIYKAAGITEKRRLHPASSMQGELWVLT